ncbi:Rieske (2Fe-2S) protein [Glycomyces buryatensis]|nr:Rieske (2Fe-2S) protein [Glycomyces buryatensis]
MTDTESGRAIAQQVLTSGRGLASRRGLMCGLAGLGAAGALAACGTVEPSSSGSDPTTGTDEGDTGDDSGSGDDTALASTADVPEGGGIVVDETVLVQPSADEFLAFSALCPHQGTVVDAPNADGVIICPNHFSEFSLEGELEQGPAEAGLTEVDITVEGDQIFLA